MMTSFMWPVGMWRREGAGGLHLGWLFLIAVAAFFVSMFTLALEWPTDLFVGVLTFVVGMVVMGMRASLGVWADVLMAVALGVIVRLLYGALL